MKLLLFAFAIVLAILTVVKIRQKDWPAAAACALVTCLDLWMAVSYIK